MYDMVVSWAAKRKLIYFAIIAGVVIGIGTLFLALFYPEDTSSCFNGVRDMGEQGVDCGGDCERLCLLQVTDPVTLWSRFLKTGQGSYDVIALVENQNLQGAAPRVPYSFKLYDSNNILIVERQGETFANPRERLVIFESNLQTGERIPARVLFKLGEIQEWRHLSLEMPELAIEDREFEPSETRPRLRANLVNRTFSDFEDIEIAALLFNSAGNVIGASRTLVSRLEKDERQEIVFLFPQPVEQMPARIDISPRINLLLHAENNN